MTITHERQPDHTEMEYAGIIAFVRIKPLNDEIATHARALRLSVA